MPLHRVSPKRVFQTSLTFFFFMLVSTSQAWEFGQGRFLNFTFGQVNQTGLSTQNPVVGSFDGYPFTASFPSQSTQGTDVGAELGITSIITPKLALLWSGGLYQTSGTKISGDYTYDTSVSSGPDGHYQYSLSSLRLMLLGTARYVLFERLPDLSLLGQIGAGYGQLRANSYSANSFNAVDALGFNSTSRYQFMYQYGIGTEYQVASRWALGLHYDWLNQGSATLSSTNAAEPMAEGLATGTVKMTRVSVQVRYQFKE